jgi:hypothetical protein
MNDYSPATPCCPLDSLDTPCLLLDEARMERNIARLRDRMRARGASHSGRTSRQPNHGKCPGG